MLPNIPAINNPEKYIGFELPVEKVKAALAEAYKKVDFAMECHGDKFPREYSANNVYATTVLFFVLVNLTITVAN